jgi:hypothetical protein
MTEMKCLPGKFLINKLKIYFKKPFDRVYRNVLFGIFKDHVTCKLIKPIHIIYKVNFIAMKVGTG